MKKLSASERKELQTWQKRMITVFAVTMTALLVVVATDLIGLQARILLPSADSCGAAVRAKE